MRASSREGGKVQRKEQKKERAFLLAKDFVSYGGSLLRRWRDLLFAEAWK